MTTAAQHVQAWRDQKRRDGYVPMTVWLKPSTKRAIEDLAHRRREDSGQVIAEAILIMSGTEGLPSQAAYTDVPTVLRLIDERLGLLTPHQAYPVTAPASRAIPLSPVLSRGEYGWKIQAVRIAAQELRRFTCTAMAKHLHDTESHTFATLRSLVKKGELIKKGTLYFWVEPPTTPSEQAALERH